MQSITIVVKDVIKTNKAIESASGEKLHERISAQIKQGNAVVLDFKGITTMLSLFLNPAIGDLYGIFPEEIIKEYLKIENFPSEYTETFRRVIARAKNFYSNKEKITNIIDTGIGNNNGEE